MAARMKIYVLDKSNEKISSIGPFNDSRLVGWWVKETSSDQGEMKIDIAEAQLLASKLYPCLHDIRIPDEIDDVNSVSTLNSINSISSVCQLFIRYKENNKKVSGFLITWG